PGLRLRGLLAACLGGVADEAELAAELGHDGVAGVDALGAVDALHLEAVADVDAHGTDLDAHAAVDAVAGAVIALALLAARLAAVGVVADDEGAAIEQDALEAPVGAGDVAHLLPEEGEVEHHQAGDEHHQ